KQQRKLTTNLTTNYESYFPIQLFDLPTNYTQSLKPCTPPNRSRQQYYDQYFMSNWFVEPQSWGLCCREAVPVRRNGNGGKQQQQRPQSSSGTSGQKQMKGQNQKVGK
ncbi:hypothetical protein HDU76_008101, partial [Blyttiomyces sp. JEL0837]